MNREQRMKQARPNLDSLPVIGICGCSGAGKTTLIERLIAPFNSMGIRLAVVKHDAHNIQLDRKGKDSYRFYHAGADTFLLGEEQIGRQHGRCDLPYSLAALCSDYDFVLVEGHATTPVPKIWILSEGHVQPPENSGQVLRICSRQEAGGSDIQDWIREYLVSKWMQAPVWGCVLIGGKSRRMGRPKHLISSFGKTWLEHTVARLAPHVDRIVLSGRGRLPAELAHMTRIPDVDGLAGPLAGVLAIQRWEPSVSWIVVACDQPDIQDEALRWLLEQRRPGVRAILPCIAGRGKIEPLLAYYDLRCKTLLERLAAGGSMRLSNIAEEDGVLTVRPPEVLHASWLNVNTTEELDTFTMTLASSRRHP